MTATKPAPLIFSRRPSPSPCFPARTIEQLGVERVEGLAGIVADGHDLQSPVGTTVTIRGIGSNSAGRRCRPELHHCSTASTSHAPAMSAIDLLDVDGSRSCGVRKGRLRSQLVCGTINIVTRQPTNAREWRPPDRW